MGVPAFELHRPTTIEEATELVDQFGDDAVFHCGGTELMLVMKLGLAPYGHLVDVKSIGELGVGNASGVGHQGTSETGAGEVAT